MLSFILTGFISTLFSEFTVFLLYLHFLVKLLSFISTINWVRMFLGISYASVYRKCLYLWNWIIYSSGGVVCPSKQSVLNSNFFYIYLIFSATYSQLSQLLIIFTIIKAFYRTWRFLCFQHLGAICMHYIRFPGNCKGFYDLKTTTKFNFYKKISINI